jgi:hypothetical protein
MPWPEVRGRLNATLRGCSNYFCLGDRYAAYRAVNHHVYQRVRVFLSRRHISALAVYCAIFGRRCVRKAGCSKRGTSGLMSGEGKRAAAGRPRTAPFLDSTPPDGDARSIC